MLETEMDNHLGYDRYERCGEPNYHSGTKPKTVRSKYGEFQVEVPQDRQSSFDPQVLPKRQKDISSIDDKIIAMYEKGMTTRKISETIEDIYGFEVSEGMISDITDKLLPRIEEWQNSPLSPVYTIVFILMAIFGGLFGSSTLSKLISNLGSLVIFVLSVWVSLELMARQTTLTKMQVFIAGIVTFVIFVIISLIFMALFGGCAALVGR